jgi:acetoin utilization protein AcuC
VLPLLRKFRPQILVSQHGCDTHWSDPLADLQVSINAQRAAHALVDQLAHETAYGNWLLTGGGEDQLVQVVPRTWTHLLAEASGRPIEPATPTPAMWRECALGRDRARHRAMAEGASTAFPSFDSGYDPTDLVGQASWPPGTPWSRGTGRFRDGGSFRADAVLHEFRRRWD